MALRIYNTLTGQKEDFVPLNPPKVKMYVCGPTVYDEPHIGHLRSAFVFNVIRKWLGKCKYGVLFVRNVTDVDDKIIEKARQEKTQDLKQATADVSSRYYDLYKADLDALDIDEPSDEPRATKYIENMRDLISLLIQKGCAYHVDGTSDVYFDVKKFPQYGRLSKQKSDEMLEEVRKESAAGKRNSLDFALWKGAKPEEPSWSSPWGEGRPGWHIECSAMNLACLGEQIDIHGGGLDLKFPHHENEIAQTESATGKQFAKYWIHHGLVTVNGQKMSKSLKNFIKFSDVRINYGSNALKMFFLSASYSSSVDYSDQAMAEAKNQYERFANFFRDVKKHSKDEPAANGSDWDDKFQEAMNDDFNTPKALSVMHELIEAARKSKISYSEAAKLLKAWGSVLGGLFDSIEQSISFHDRAQGVLIDERIKERKLAKDRRDFAAADAIRKELIAEGVEIRDLPDGTTEWWVKK